MAEHIHADKYELASSSLKEIKLPVDLDGKDLGFINMLNGRYRELFLYLVVHSTNYLWQYFRDFDESFS